MSCFRISLDRNGKAAVVTAAVAFVLSLGHALAARPSNASSLTSDSLEYYRLAVSILRDHSFQGSLFRAPGYPAFLAAVFGLTGSTALWPVYLVQSALVAVTILLVHRIAYRITSSVRTSILSAAICALWPPIWMSAGDVLTETLSAALTAVVLLVVFILTDRRSPALAILLGLVCGLTTLTKGPFLLYSIYCAVFVAVSDKVRRRGLTLGLCTAVAASVVLLPWMVRNYVVSGQFVLVQTGGGMNFWLGNSPEFWRTEHRWGSYPRDVQVLIEGKPEVERERILAKLGWKTISEDPARALGIFLRKFSYLWLGALGADPGSAGNPIPHIGSFGLPKRSFVYVPLFLLAVFGWLGLDKAARSRARPMIALLVLWSLPYIATMAVARYALPVVCYEIVLASAGIDKLIMKRKRDQNDASV